MNPLFLLPLVQSLAGGVYADVLSGSPPSVEIARSPGASCDLKADAQFIYWTTEDHGTTSTKRAGGWEPALDWARVSSTIRRVPKAGGAVATLATIKGNAAFLLNLDDSHLYWNGLRTGELWRLAKSGGKAVVLGVDRAQLYWAEHGDGGTWSLKVAPIGGGQPHTFAQFMGIPMSVVFSDDIYFIAGPAAYRLSREARSPSTPVTSRLRARTTRSRRCSPRPN